jgi:hypothetical protein
MTGNFAANFLPIDTAILSHEVDEWMDDPMISNPYAALGTYRTGCGMPSQPGSWRPSDWNLSPRGQNAQRLHLSPQELAFFSWFFGAPSVGVNGWFSDNGTFLTDAGPPCT